MMPSLPLRRSLSFRLSLMLSALIVLFWVVTTGLTFFLDFRDMRAELVNHLEEHTLDRADRARTELASVARDLKTLLGHWQSLQALQAVQDLHQVHPLQANRPTATSAQPRHLAAEFIPAQAGRPVSINSSNNPIKRALNFTQTYGASGMGEFISNFVLLDSGLVLNQSVDSGGARREQIAHIEMLRHIAPKEGLIWGNPYPDHQGQWRVAAGAVEPRSGAIVGITVVLSSLTGGISTLHNAQTIWLDEQGQLLTASPSLVRKELLIKLPECSAFFSQRIDDIRTVCTRIEPAGWRLVQLYPTRLLTSAAIKVIERRVPVALLTLALLVSLLYFSLQHSLGRVLDTFIRVIRPRSGSSAQKRLPENRRDELGQIARAYNHLLDTVQAHYAQLETKVAERTVELDAAMRRAEQASSNKSEQITSISHEIRTPLNGIVGALLLLRQTGCDADQLDLVDTAVKCSGHLLEIVNNLLDFSRIEAGQMLVMPSLLDPLLILDQAMLTVQTHALAKQLKLTLHVAAPFPQLLYTDGLRLRQILINLLANAVKFTPAGGVHLRAWSEGAHIYFEVTDTGPGIAPADSEKVFTAFNQLDIYAQGSGLGLPIARSLAQLLGGDLRLLPAASGARFQLQLALGEAPFAPAAGAPEPVVAPPALHAQLQAWGYAPVAGENPALAAPELVYLPARLRQRLKPQARLDEDGSRDTLPACAWSLQVLVVDDVATNRDIMSRMLHQQGHRPHQAASGEAALALARTLVFDAVLLDMRMPGLGGVQTLAHWRSESSGILDPDCPIIAFTANAQPGERERLSALGFTGYLAKPATPAMLAQALHEAADLQLSRGMELAPNTLAQQPLLGPADALDDGLRQRLRASLLQYHEGIEKALATADRAAALEALHTFRGIAGLAGLEQLHQAAQAHEQRLKASGLITAEAAASWAAIRPMIEAIEEHPPTSAAPS